MLYNFDHVQDKTAQHTSCIDEFAIKWLHVSLQIEGNKSAFRINVSKKELKVKCSIAKH